MADDQTTNGLPYYPRYPRDFIEGTIGMPFEQKAAYGLVLDLIYMRNGRLPDDSRYIAGLLGVSVRKWNTLRSALLGRRKLKVIGEFLTNDRAIIEVKKLRKYQEKQSENRAGARKNSGLERPRSNHTDTDTEENKNPPSPFGDSPPRDDEQSFDHGDGEQTRAVALDKPEPPPPKRNPSRGTRLPNDWTPDAKARQAAADEGLTDEEIDRSAQRFRDYWIAQPSGKGVKCDWGATWRNWVRRDVDDGRVGRGVGRGPQRGGIASGQGGPQDSSFAASVARAVERQSPRRAAGGGPG